MSEQFSHLDTIPSLEQQKEKEELATLLGDVQAHPIDPESLSHIAMPTKSIAELSVFEDSFGAGISSVQVFGRTGKNRERTRRDAGVMNKIDVDAVMRVSFAPNQSGEVVHSYYIQMTTGEFLIWDADAQQYRAQPQNPENDENVIEIRNGRLELRSDIREKRERVRVLRDGFENSVQKILASRLYERLETHTKNSRSIHGEPRLLNQKIFNPKTGKMERQEDVLKDILQRLTYDLQNFENWEHISEKKKTFLLQKYLSSDFDFLWKDGVQFSPRQIDLYMDALKTSYAQDLFSEDHLFYAEAKKMGELVLGDVFDLAVYDFEKNENTQRQDFQESIEKDCDTPPHFTRRGYLLTKQGRIFKKDGITVVNHPTRVHNEWSYDSVFMTVDAQAEHAAIQQIEKESGKQWDTLQKNITQDVTQIVADIDGISPEERAFLVDLNVGMILDNFLLPKKEDYKRKQALKASDFSRLSGDQKRVWDQYNDLVDPQDEFWNMDEKNQKKWTETICREVVINGTLIALSGGMGSLARTGISSLAKKAGTRMSPFAKNILVRRFGEKSLEILNRKGLQKGLEIAGKSGLLVAEGTVFEMTFTSLSLFFGVDGASWPQNLPEFAKRSLQSTVMLGVFHGSGRLSNTLFPPKSTLKKATQNLLSTRNGTALKSVLVEFSKSTARLGVEASTMLLLSAGQAGVLGEDAFEAFLENIEDESLHALVTVLGLRAGGRLVAPLRARMKKIEKNIQKIDLFMRQNKAKVSPIFGEYNLSLHSKDWRLLWNVSQMKNKNGESRYVQREFFKAQILKNHPEWNASQVNIVSMKLLRSGIWGAYPQPNIKKTPVEELKKISQKKNLKESEKGEQIGEYTKKDVTEIVEKIFKQHWQGMEVKKDVLENAYDTLKKQSKNQIVERTMLEYIKREFPLLADLYDLGSLKDIVDPLRPENGAERARLQKKEAQKIKERTNRDVLFFGPRTIKMAEAIIGIELPSLERRILWDCTRRIAKLKNTLVEVPVKDENGVEVIQKKSALECANTIENEILTLYFYQYFQSRRVGYLYEHLIYNTYVQNKKTFRKEKLPKEGEDFETLVLEEIHNRPKT